MRVTADDRYRDFLRIEEVQGDECMKKIIVVICLVLLVGSLAGCKGESIANDKIVISQYKGLKVEADENDDDFKEQVLEALLDNCEIKEFPQEELKERIEQLTIDYGYVAYYKNITAEELILEKTGLSVEELAKKELTKEYALALIAETEGMDKDATEEEIFNFLIENLK